jgi:hypothetical protein
MIAPKSGPLVGLRAINRIFHLSEGGYAKIQQLVWVINFSRKGQENSGVDQLCLVPIGDFLGSGLEPAYHRDKCLPDLLDR